MQNLFGDQPSESDWPEIQSSGSGWGTRVLGFLGSAIICWVVLKLLAPVIAGSWGIGWITNGRIRVVGPLIIALPFAALLGRIEGTIWGKYYVIVGYLLSLALVTWIVCICFTTFDQSKFR